MATIEVLVLLFMFVCSSQQQVDYNRGMLFPQESESREVKDLSGMWTFKKDPRNIGMSEQWWMNPLAAPTIPMPVPSSYNDITQDEALRKHVGWVWYEVYFRVPASWNGRRIALRFESASYYAISWLNTVQIVEHEGGHLPFEADVGSVLIPGMNRLVVAVNNTLTPTTLPPGDIVTYPGNPFYPANYSVQVDYFDFFNYAGIHRPVYLYTTPLNYVDDITLNYELESNGGATVHYNISVIPNPSTLLVTLLDDRGNVVGQSSDFIGNITLEAANTKLWEPRNPYLYTLVVTSAPGSAGSDIYRLESVGIRTMKITPTQFLINNKPFYFHGVDKHEDSDIRGKGFDNVILAKDFNMLNWLSANSFRTSHYPYATPWYQMSDQQGIVIIGECPAVGLGLAEYFSAQTLAHHKQIMFEMIRRDKNHPSVVMWNVANEPVSDLPVANDYFLQLSEYVRAIDPTHRPLTLVQDVDFQGQTCAEYFDVICVNRYYAWYSDSGELDLIKLQLKYDLNGWYAKYNKPIIVSEYGADTVPGVLEDPPMMFSTQFQVDFMKRYHEAFDELAQDFLIGELVWNFADFRTDSSDIRVGAMNMKGILTRQRQPKPAAYDLKKRYEKLSLKLKSKNAIVSN